MDNISLHSYLFLPVSNVCGCYNTINGWIIHIVMGLYVIFVSLMLCWWVLTHCPYHVITTHVLQYVSIASWCSHCLCCHLDANAGQPRNMIEYHNFAMIIIIKQEIWTIFNLFWEYRFAINTQTYVYCKMKLM